MKKLFRSLILLFLTTPTLLSAGTKSSDNPFTDNPACWEQECAALSQLEALTESTGLTLSQLQASGNPLAESVLADDNLYATLIGATTPEEERLMGIPGFLWGFCCSFVGTFLVYLSIEDPVAKKREGSQAIIGCAAGTILWVGLYIWLLVSLSV
ncbi:MAG TPA: hypothetical protein VK168_21130 [Saprospiraceae bacterium]|nr:hypothetical protein [Saprospiraceae bacterium]